MSPAWSSHLVACCYVGQVGNLRPIGNRPLAQCHAPSRWGDSAFVGSANPGCSRLSGGFFAPRDALVSAARDAPEVIAPRSGKHNHPRHGSPA
jgi:hypothetical protein